MINPIQFAYTQHDGRVRRVIAEPILKDATDGVSATRTYKVYKDATDSDTTLFTDPSQIGKENNDVSEEINPDYIGTITFNETNQWDFNGDLLSENEQRQLAGHLLAQNS